MSLFHEFEICGSYELNEVMSKRVCLSLNPKRRCYAILVRLMGILDIHELG